jgi:hypothetical protein
VEESSAGAQGSKLGFWTQTTLLTWVYSSEDSGELKMLGCREPSESPDKPCVIYTPVYAGSPGTRYRVDLLLESLHNYGYDPKLIVDEKEDIFNQLYERFSTNLLSKRFIWSTIGRHIAGKVSTYKPPFAILMLDVCAGAAVHLHRRGVKTAVFVEDLTASYHYGIQAKKERAEQVMKILSNELAQSDLVVAPSHVLSRVLAYGYGIDAMTVPVGTKTYISLDMACKREPNLALHVGQIHDMKQADALTETSQRLAKQNIETLAHKAGKYAHLVKGVRWYSYASPQEAIPHVQKAFLGVVTRFRPAFTLSSLYYHTGLLQPILAVGEGSWIEEAELLGMSLVKETGGIGSDDLQKQANAASRLEIPRVHEPLAKALSKL